MPEQSISAKCDFCRKPAVYDGKTQRALGRICVKIAASVMAWRIPHMCALWPQ